MKNAPGPSKRGSIDYVKGPFDYSQIGANLAEEARAAAQKINASKRDHIIVVGSELAKIKSKLPEGQFLDWIDRELRLSAATCRNYMAAAREFRNTPLTVSAVPLRHLYRFAATAPDIRAPIVARIEAGERVEREEIEQAIRKPSSKNQEAGHEERQRQEQAATELVRMLAKYFDKDNIIEINSLWSKSRSDAVLNALTTLGDTEPLRDTCAEMIAAWNAASLEARQEFLSRIMERHKDGGRASC